MIARTADLAHPAGSMHAWPAGTRDPFLEGKRERHAATLGCRLVGECYCARWPLSPPISRWEDGFMSAVDKRTSARLFTLGYEKRSLEEYLSLLRQAAIDVVVDVRDVPWNHKPGFSRQPLADALAAAGIEYVHAGFAGNPKALRSQASDNAQALKLYADHLRQHPEILDELDALLESLLANHQRLCLTCFERVPRECHRGVLAAAWIARHGATVLHLGNDGSGG
jgi:hypothetical protein